MRVNQRKNSPEREIFFLQNCKDIIVKENEIKVEGVDFTVIFLWINSSYGFAEKSSGCSKVMLYYK